MASLRMLTWAARICFSFAIGSFAFLAPTPAHASWSKAAVCGMTTQGNQNFIGTSTTHSKASLQTFSPSTAALPTNALEEAIIHPGVYHSANVAILWQQIQPNSANDFDTSAIDAALTAIDNYNFANYSATNPVPALTATLQIFAGINAPMWAQQLDGGPLYFSDSNSTGTVTTTYSIGKFWSQDYVNAWRQLQAQLAAKYDNDPRVQQVQVTSCSSYTAEPFILHDSQQITPNSATPNIPGFATTLLSVDPNFSSDYLSCLNGAATDYANWQNTPLDFPFNNFTSLSLKNGSPVPSASGATANSIMASWALIPGTNTRNPLHLDGNHGLQGPAGVFMNAQGVASPQKAVVFMGQSNAGSLAAPYQGPAVDGIAYYGGGIEFQLDGPTSSSPAMTSGLDSAFQAGLAYGMTNFQMWETLDSGDKTGSPIYLPQLQAWAAEFTCVPATPAPCGSTQSGTMGAQVISQTTSNVAAPTSQCPYGGTMPMTTTVSQPFLCINGTTFGEGSPTTATTPGTPICTAAAACGSTPSGSTKTTVTTTTGSIPATTSQCPYGGTQATTTTSSQVYLCTNGTLTAQGAPTVTTVNTGNPVCTAAAACGSTPSGSTKTTVTTTTGSIPATTSQCPYGGTQATTTTSSQVYLCTNGTLTAQGAPTVTTVNTGNPVCTAAAACGSTPSGSTKTTVTTTTGSIPATTSQCPYGGTQATTTTSSQVYLCTNGTLTAQGAPTVTTVNTGNPVCTAGASCGSLPNGGTESIIVSQNQSTAAATANQCFFGGGQVTTTTTTQLYLCANGTLAVSGSPTTSTVTGALTCNAPTTFTTLGHATNFLGLGEADTITQDTYGNITLAGTTNQGRNAGNEFLLHATSPVPFAPNTTIIGSGSDFVGAGERDLITRDPSGILTDWAFDSQGQWMGGQFLSYGTQPVPFEPSVTVIGSGTNYFGAGERDLITRDPSGLIINWGFDGTGQWIGSQFLQNGPFAVPFESDANVIGLTSNFFDLGERDIVTRDTAGTVINWGFDGSGQWIGSEFLVQSTTAQLPVATYSVALGAAHGIQATETNDQIVRAGTGAFALNEFNSLGILTYNGTMAVVGNQTLAQLNGSTIQNFNGKTSLIDITDLPFTEDIDATFTPLTASSGKIVVTSDGETIATVNLQSPKAIGGFIVMPDGMAGTLLVETNQ